MSWLTGMGARLRLLFGRRSAESRMEREFRFHVDMETDRLVRKGGLDRAEARRQALIAFGGVERHKEEMRSDRGAAWISGMALDFRLGLRMIVKYPGLAIVGVVGMAVAVAISAVAFGVIYTIIDPTLPLDEGDRLVVIQNVDTRAGDDGATHLHDIATWREGMSAVEMIGAYHMTDRNLITPQGRPESVRIAEMSASGFRVARVPPLMGRYFDASDEQPGAPPVVVIGKSVWENRFASRPDILGQTLQLGAVPHTIIGVMPESFAFPVNNRIWTPLQLDPSDYERGNAPRIDVFGRLVPGATLADAQTQAATIGARLATTWPTIYEHITPRVLPYARAFVDSPELIWVFHLVQVLITMLLVVIGTNVAVLVYARTATRMGEIAVRSALGASRMRIVAQLFAEALVLSSAAAVIGLSIAWLVLDQVNVIVEREGGEQLPFWMDFRGISPGLVVYVAGLAVLAAVIVGVLPALRATRRDVHASLKQVGAAGAGMELGKLWTILIVTQVAMAVIILPFAMSGLGQWVRMGVIEPGFAAKEFLTASLRLDREGAGIIDPRRDDAAFVARYAALKAELTRRLEAEPSVARVVLTSAMPGDEPTVRIEPERLVTLGADSAAGRGAAGYPVRASRVDLDFFDAFDIPILIGRKFEPGDVAAGATGVIVNRAFVQKVLGGGDALGRRVRRAVNDDNGASASVQRNPWYEIVGVVPDFPNPVSARELEPKLYQPMTPTAAGVDKLTVTRRFVEEFQPGASGAGDTRPVTLAIRVRGAAPETFAGRLRDITVSVDPMLRLERVGALDTSLHDNLAVTRLSIIAVAALTLSVLLLSAAGIYALMSFTINRRRREIGIRSALGAGAQSVLWSVLSRAMGQIGIGIVVGLGIVGLMQVAGSGEAYTWEDTMLLLGVAGLMLVVGVTATIGPARRALSIQPTEALRSDG